MPHSQPSSAATLPPASCPFRLLVQTAAQFAFGHGTGGPECLVNLAIALAANLPHGCTSIFTGNELHGALRPDYPDFGALQQRGVEGHEEALLRRGDMLILPEIDECPAHLVNRGVRVWIYQLGTSPACHRLRQGCRFFVHNSWLSNQFGVNVTRQMVVRPPMNPTHIAERHKYALPPERRVNRVLINGHDLPAHALEAIQTACRRVAQSGRATDVSCEVPHGHSKPKLRTLMGESKVVIAWCMRGTERLPIEAAVYGAVMLTNDCAVGSDPRDFPLPEHHRLPTAEALAETMASLLSSESAHRLAFQQQQPLRELYLGIGPRSMAKEAAAFLRVAAQPQPAEELGNCESRGGDRDKKM